MVKVAGVEHVEGLTRETYVEVTDSSAAGPASPHAPPSRYPKAPWRRASWASRHVDNMLDNVPEAADLLGFY